MGGSAWHFHIVYEGTINPEVLLATWTCASSVTMNKLTIVPEATEAQSNL